MSAPAAPPSARSLALATLAALGVAVLVLVLFVLPAEYGIDPTGVGKALGLDALGEAPPTDPGGNAPQNATAPIILATYESSFPTTSTEVLQEEGALAEGATVLVPFTLAQANVSKVTVRIAFQDANTTPDGRSTRPDTFEIELKAPHGDVSGGVLVRSDATSGGGFGEATYVVRAPPFPREIEASSLGEARDAFLRNDPPDTTLTGEWRARVTMVEAGDADVQGAPLPGVAGTPASDDGNAYTIVVSVQTYSLAVAEKPGTRQRSDTATLEIPAGGELEYKLAMALGKRVDYSWRTNGPIVYVDFHGEKTGDASGAFTRHKNGDLAADAGTLVAPFDGRHGWFWRNSESAPVTITLETRGQYEVIGRV